MLENDFSQLPVMTSETVVKGLFSWKSLGARLALARKCTAVRECMDRCYEVRNDTSLFGAIDDIVRHECVLVKHLNNKISGMVTTSDPPNHGFNNLTEPFLLLAEIENHIRDLMSGTFTNDDLRATRDPDQP